MSTYAATLGGLRSRIIAETNRDDLSDDLATALDQTIADAIEFYAAERFWWNEARDTSTTTAGNQYTTRPTGARIVDTPFLVIGNVRYRIIKRDRDWIEGMYTTPLSGQPTDYCEMGTQVRWWPTPSSAWTVVWMDIDDATALDYSSSSSSNAWTTYAQPLIAARARMILCRNYFRDDDGYQRAVEDERQWYGVIKSETNKRLGTGRIKPS